ncbi:AAA family ATPase [Taklimakanibacter deserti]|uniref:AAA family ATPase n=1 Tax=Taklimakanibacter deserti TaxID=2267839 RepID=UPI0034D44729
MRFVVGSYPAPEAAPICVLIKADWNDWFKWYTLYNVTIIQPNGTRVGIGRVKIGRKGMVETQGSTELPAGFGALDQSFFSIGQNENYYETLIELGDDFRINYLQALRDCAFALNILEENEDEAVMVNSLLRDIETRRVRERLHRLANAQVALTEYSFTYEFPATQAALTPPPILSFAVYPNSRPATNIHVLIGRNGVGKTRCFDFLARTLLGISAEDPNQQTGLLRNTMPQANSWLSDEEDADPGFAGLVTVSFSAFDARGPLVLPAESKKRYSYIGLVTSEPLAGLNLPPLSTLRVKSLRELADEFAKSVAKCREGVRRGRWMTALESLEADPLFAEAAVTTLANEQVPDVESRARNLFLRLSSGHAAVLLSITSLVEQVEEKSLVLIDEPEGHLHPPLLSAFVRALSQLLTNRNGVAIIATHSPVVLQEVPASCVWKLGRAGHEVRADRPERETFGENLGVLTREVFGLEVTQTGFHKLIADIAPGSSYEQILQAFNGQLGAEGRALARAISLLPPGQ